ncbi:hypothetical protein SAMN02927923_03192 [Microvirga guangxiensis]|uniref:Uncharacterized protein n=1 Tax=Microvirga guangxiensis TaxID=549386 RepID=A0A1G5KBJ1_9HYPH|nr:hypothetical protein SAMN02927923_03192 [Microvirga guangxiensis]
MSIMAMTSQDCTTMLSGRDADVRSRFLQLWHQVRDRYEEWRYDRDVDHIETTFDQLSRRQPALLGISRSRLETDIERLIAHRGSRMDLFPPPYAGKAITGSGGQTRLVRTMVHRV